MTIIHYVDEAAALEEAEASGDSVLIYENVADCAGMYAYPGGHLIQCGGQGGDGFCFTHQSFDCFDHLPR